MALGFEKVLTDDEERSLNNDTPRNQYNKMGTLIRDLQRWCDWLTSTGVSGDHAVLQNRFIPGQHDIGAIDGLITALSDLNTSITLNSDDIQALFQSNSDIWIDLGKKATKVTYPAIPFDGNHLNAKPPYSIVFDTTKHPMMDQGPGFFGWQISGHPLWLFGFWSQDGLTTKVGIFDITNTNTLQEVSSIYDGTSWLYGGVWKLRYGVDAQPQSMGNLLGFDTATDMTIPAMPNLDLKNLVDTKQDFIYPALGKRNVVTSELDGHIAADVVEISPTLDGSNRKMPLNVAVKQALDLEVQARQDADTALGARVDQISGLGGSLHYNDFGTLTPTQSDLVQYFCEQIFGAGGTFTWNAQTPSQSTYVVGGVTHLAVELFNSTWCRNSYQDSNHRFELTNTPTTQPPVFYIEDVGFDTVGSATSSLAGIAKLYNATGNNTDGGITQAAASSAIEAEVVGGIDEHNSGSSSHSDIRSLIQTEVQRALAVESQKQDLLNRTVQTNLASVMAAQDGGGNISPGVTGVLSTANGGTGANSASGALVSLGAAPLDSPVLIGTPKAPTPAFGAGFTDATKKLLATAEYVDLAALVRMPDWTEFTYAAAISGNLLGWYSGPYFTGKYWPGGKRIMRVDAVLDKYKPSNTATVIHEGVTPQIPNVAQYNIINIGGSFRQRDTSLQPYHIPLNIGSSSSATPSRFDVMFSYRGFQLYSINANYSAVDGYRVIMWAEWFE
jgi:hypothetical protein